jgi:hypothetical protein
MANDGGRHRAQATPGVQPDPHSASDPATDSPSVSTTTEIPRELPQSFGVVAHIWSRERGPIDPAFVPPVDGDAAGEID